MIVVDKKMISSKPQKLKDEIPRLNREDIQGVLSAAFPGSIITSFKFEEFGSGIINLTLKITDIVLNLNEKINDLVLKVMNTYFGPHKTQNEAVVMQFLEKHLVESGLMTASFIPHVYHYDCEGKILPKNLRYILMQFIEGTPLKDLEFENQPLEKRLYFLDQMAEFYASLKSFYVVPQKIGCFVSISDPDISKPLHCSAVLTCDVDSWLDPVDNFKDYFVGTMKFRVKNIKNRITYSKNEEDRLFYIEILGYLEEIVNKTEHTTILDTISWDENDDRLCLSHIDLNKGNILVDKDTLSIQAIIDWEWTSLAPFELDTLSLGFVQYWGEDHFFEKLQQKWDLISKKFPYFNLGVINPHPSSESNFHKRKLWMEIITYGMVCASIESWNLPNWEHEKAKLLDEGKKILSKLNNK